ncbi:hypothetical protein [Thioclava sp. SK-1]|uniref:capsular polysaccharide export protein, LipB/KpsS family n=1 Tax=Thioclava sp. SK-1 TaxID=1889770 RepID=UPI00159F31D1|nr:hypothetical protein [Thioclava sp. SK-1]
MSKPTIDQIEAGQRNFFRRLIIGIEDEGWHVEMAESTPDNRRTARDNSWYTLYHMEEPGHENALTCRQSYVGPFWRIERMAERWEWPVAKAQFDPAVVDMGKLGWFYEGWLNRLYEGGKHVSDDGFLFVPLQGKLLEQRSFQSMSPLRMLEEVLQRRSEPVVATLHPRETYSTAETDALRKLQHAYPRLTVRTGHSEKILPHCHGVVTQNSGLGFQGLFLQKPLVLFAQSEFHHIAGSVPRDGLDEAFRHLDYEADYQRYVTWFLHMTALNAGRPEFEAAMAQRLRDLGWPI